MNILRIFGIGAGKILAKNHSVQGIVTGVCISRIHVAKKPVRIMITENNTMFSHYILFQYTVDNVMYNGKLYIDLRYRCPQKGETISVFYDPEDPRQYACYAFGPGTFPIGW